VSSTLFQEGYRVPNLRYDTRSHRQTFHHTLDGSPRHPALLRNPALTNGHNLSPQLIHECIGAPRSNAIINLPVFIDPEIELWLPFICFFADISDCGRVHMAALRDAAVQVVAYRMDAEVLMAEAGFLL
jgi:hypothetical protein